MSLVFVSSAFSQNNIQKAEYWFDSDYGTVNEITISFGPRVSYIENPDITELKNGLHTIHFRFRDENLVWSSPTSTFFLKTAATNFVGLNEIISCQYWFDSDLTTSKQINLTNAPNLSYQNQLNFSDLRDGLHTLHFRFLDKNQSWSSSISKFVIKVKESQLVSDNKITSYRYWFDDSEINEIALDENTENLHLFDTLRMHAIEKGEHIVHLQFKDSKELWSSVIHDTIEKISYPISKFDLSTDFYCDSSIVSFNNTSIDGDFYLWNFGDDSTSNDFSAVHNYLYPGTFEISLLVRDTVLEIESVISKTIQIKGVSFGETDITVCDSYNSPSGKIWTSTGAYLDTIQNSIGCDSIILFNLTVNKIDTSISVNGMQLIANENNAGYQWMKDGLIIESANQQTYTVSEPGLYSLIISKNSCTDASRTFSFDFTGINNQLFSSGIKLYPNPGNGIFSIELGKEYQSILISIIDITGKIISSNEYFSKSIINFNLEAKNGLYFLEIKTDSGEKAMLKVVKN